MPSYGRDLESSHKERADQRSDFFCAENIKSFIVYHGSRDKRHRPNELEQGRNYYL